MFRKILGKFSKKVRIQFIDHESLSQSRLWIVRPSAVWLFAMFSLLAVIAGTASVVVFTPQIREHIPGYMNPELATEHLTQKQRYDSLLAKVEQLESVQASMQRVHGSGELNAGNLSIDDVIAEGNFPNYDYGEFAEPGNDNGDDPALINRPIEAGGTPPANVGYQVLNLIPPLVGTISSTFKPNNPLEKHFGIDIVANKDALIGAIADGFVIFSEYSNQTGYVIGISHGNGLISFYKHNSRVFKKAGSYVFAGEAIAVIGNSGENTTGPHLHFELWNNGKPVNPETYIAFRR